MTVIPFRPRSPERAYDPKGYTGPPAPGDCGAVCARSVDDLCPDADAQARLYDAWKADRDARLNAEDAATRLDIARIEAGFPPMLPGSEPHPRILQEDSD